MFQYFCLTYSSFTFVSTFDCSISNNLLFLIWQIGQDMSPAPRSYSLHSTGPQGLKENGFLNLPATSLAPASTVLSIQVAQCTQEKIFVFNHLYFFNEEHFETLNTKYSRALSSQVRLKDKQEGNYLNRPMAPCNFCCQKKNLGIIDIIWTFSQNYHQPPWYPCSYLKVSIIWSVSQNYHQPPWYPCFNLKVGII